MTTAILDKEMVRHLVVTVQVGDQLCIVTRSKLKRNWLTTKQPIRTTYEIINEIDFHNRLRSRVALRGDKIVKDRCDPKFI